MSVNLSTRVFETERGFELRTFPDNVVLGWAEVRPATGDETGHKAPDGDATHVTVYKKNNRSVGTKIYYTRDHHVAAVAALNVYLVYPLWRA